MQLRSLARPLNVAVLAGTLFTGACGDSTGSDAGETELISRVELRLTPVAGGAPLTFVIRDPDGNGPQSPLPQSGGGPLAVNRAYTAVVELQNDTENPPENISTEVDAEDTEHRFFYTVTGGVTSNLNPDRSGGVLGRTFTLTPTALGNLSLRVVLCHYDANPKPAGATSCTAPGDTDIDVTFTATVTAGNN